MTSQSASPNTRERQSIDLTVLPRAAALTLNTLLWLTGSLLPVAIVLDATRDWMLFLIAAVAQVIGFAFTWRVARRYERGTTPMGGHP